MLINRNVPDALQQYAAAELSPLQYEQEHTGAYRNHDVCKGNVV